jgi:hypothetical protein
MRIGSSRRLTDQIKSQTRQIVDDPRNESTIDEFGMAASMPSQEIFRGLFSVG